jgi:hypothetical protein
LDSDVLQYISSVVVEDGRIMEKEDMLDLVGPLLVSADFIADEAQAESIVDKLIEKLRANVSAKSERPEVVLLKNAVLMGGDRESETSAKPEALLDPMLKRRGGQAFGTNVVEEELDVHSKAAIAKARADAKAQAKRALLAEQAMREQLLMEAELEEARRAVARARLSGQAPGALGTIESEPFELPNPGGGENLLEDVRLRLVRSALTLASKHAITPAASGSWSSIRPHRKEWKRKIDAPSAPQLPSHQRPPAAHVNPLCRAGVAAGRAERAGEACRHGPSRRC